MGQTIIILVVLTFVIHFVGTVFYAVRLVGLRTGKMSLAFAIFNVVTLLSRFSNTLQAPLLAKIIENNIRAGTETSVGYFRGLLLAATLATAVGGFLLPSFRRFMSGVVNGFYRYKSFFKLFYKGFSRLSFASLKNNFQIPSFKILLSPKDIPMRVMFLHLIINAFLTCSVISCLYACVLQPENRATLASMSSMVAGLAIILSLIFAEPDIALLSDKVVDGHISINYFRKYLAYVIIARLCGTIAAQFLFIPLAELLVYIASHTV